jgi:hypothetical protein
LLRARRRSGMREAERILKTWRRIAQDIITVTATITRQGTAILVVMIITGTVINDHGNLLTMAMNGNTPTREDTSTRARATAKQLAQSHHILL